MRTIILSKIFKEIQFYSPLRKHFFPRHKYMYSSAQLCFLCKCIEETRDVNGSVAEIGCASGATTVFLNNYMNTEEIEKKYYALDTFSGFPIEDIEFEVANRKKTKGQFRGFQVNKKRWFDGTMNQNRIKRVHSIEADVNEYDLTTLGGLSFILLDVDLYRPIKKSLNELYEILKPGGIMVVDDCNAMHDRWDGADQAYKEFMKEKGLEVNIYHNKLGVIRKPLVV
ncbi:MAG: class I SAM-dependent methyltransferase [Thiotrichales bacterium]|nr:class I SAM-dependent methyltransferase [Thiotrichales bacterium]